MSEDAHDGYYVSRIDFGVTQPGRESVAGSVHLSRPTESDRAEYLSATPDERRILELETAIEKFKETVSTLELANVTLRRRVESLEADRESLQKLP